jgi:hypothetical protein
MIVSFKPTLRGVSSVNEMSIGRIALGVLDSVPKPKVFFFSPELTAFFFVTTFARWVNVSQKIFRHPNSNRPTKRKMCHCGCRETKIYSNRAGDVTAPRAAIRTQTCAQREREREREREMIRGEAIRVYIGVVGNIIRVRSLSGGGMMSTETDNRDDNNSRRIVKTMIDRLGDEGMNG